MFIVGMNLMGVANCHCGLKSSDASVACQNETLYSAYIIMSK